MTDQPKPPINIDALTDLIRADIASIDTTPPEPIPDSAATRRFAPISLGDWLGLCRKAGVPHVAAEVVAVLRRSECLRFDEPEQDARNEAALQQAQVAALPNHMMRFDCCAGISTKLRASMGRPEWDPETQQLFIADPRGYDIFFEHPREEIPIWQRPWIKAQLINGYPVEYRVYVSNGRITGVSNYYPQRPLPWNERHLTTVREYTRRLIAQAETPFLWNNSASLEEFLTYQNPDGVHFTADYIVDADGRVLFLEGGPPHELGAHPCCFPPGRTVGIALRAVPGGEN